MPDSHQVDDPALVDGQHLARGAAANVIVLVAANFRGLFTFLIALPGIALLWLMRAQFAPAASA